MGNSNSRGAHAPQYPPKHTYYSEGRGYNKPRKGGGGKLQYREEPELHHEYHERYPSHSSSRYPHHYNSTSLSCICELVIENYLLHLFHSLSARVRCTLPLPAPTSAYAAFSKRIDPKSIPSDTTSTPETPPYFLSPRYDALILPSSKCSHAGARTCTCTCTCTCGVSQSTNAGWSSNTQHDANASGLGISRPFILSTRNATCRYSIP